MNNISNMVPVGQSKTSDSAVSFNSKAGREGAGGVDTEGSSVRPASFDDSLKESSGRSSQSEDKVDTELSGNNLPPEEESSELPVTDDRSLLPVSSGVAELAPTENKSPAQIASENLQQLTSSEMVIDSQVAEESAEEASTLAAMIDVGDNPDMAGKLSMLLSQVRQQQRIEQGTGENSPSNLTRAASGGLKTTDGVIASTTLQASETLALTTEQVDLMTGKSPTLSTTLNQQILSGIQSSLLQTISAQGEPALDSPPLVANTLTNNLPLTTLPTLPQAGITEAFGRPAWSQGMGKQVMWMVNQNISSAEIRLNPAHLGPIEILIDMSDDQVNVSLSSRHAIVREAMEQALPKLREMLSENGFNLADTDISKHSFAEQREQNTEHTNSRSGINHKNQSDEAEKSGRVELPSSSAAIGMVDYYI